MLLLNGKTIYRENMNIVMINYDKFVLKIYDDLERIFYSRTHHYESSNRTNDRYYFIEFNYDSIQEAYGATKNDSPKM